MSGTWQRTVGSLLLLGLQEHALAADPTSPVSRAPSQPSESSETALDPPLAAPRALCTLHGPNPSYVGQMVQIEVELLHDEREPQPPAAFFPEIRVRNAIALLSAHAPPPEQSEDQGVTFVGQKRRYLVFPQVAGPFTVPAINIELAHAGNDDFTVTTEPLSLQADVPVGAGSRLPLVARNVELSRHIDGPLEQLRVGDAFSVTLQLSAADTDPVALPRLQLPDVPGLARYPGQASSQARADRGEYHAARTDSATYVAREVGFYQLPKVSVFWLDPTTGHYARAEVPAVSFRARVNPQLGAGCLGGPRSVARFGGTLGLVMVLCVLGLKLGRNLAKRRAERSLVHRSPAEAAAFRTLCDMAHSGSDSATLTALYRWLEFSAPTHTTLHGWLERQQDDALRTAALALESRVAQGQGLGLAADVVGPLTRYRRRRHRAPSSHPKLAPLNR